MTVNACIDKLSKQSFLFSFDRNLTLTVKYVIFVVLFLTIDFANKMSYM